MQFKYTFSNLTSAKSYKPILKESLPFLRLLTLVSVKSHLLNTQRFTFLITVDSQVVLTEILQY